MSSPSIVAAVMLTVCPPGTTPAETGCTTSLNDKELAGTVTGRRSSSPLRHIAGMQEQDHMRMTGSAAGIASDKLLAELELDALSDAINNVGAADPGPLLLGNQLIVNESGGTATISTDLRIGDIQMQSSGR